MKKIFLLISIFLSILSYSDVIYNCTPYGEIFFGINSSTNNEIIIYDHIDDLTFIGLSDSNKSLNRDFRLYKIYNDIIEVQNISTNNYINIIDINPGTFLKFNLNGQTNYTLRVTKSGNFYVEFNSNTNILFYPYIKQFKEEH